MRRVKSPRNVGGTGVTGLQTNFSAYQRWVRTTHARSQYTSAAFELVGMENECHHDQHSDVRPLAIEKGLEHVEKVKEAILNFNNPCNMDKNDLVILPSGAYVQMISPLTFFRLRAKESVPKRNSLQIAFQRPVIGWDIWLFNVA